MKSLSPLSFATGGVLLALLLAAAFLRFYRLSELPPGIHFDEGSHGVDALQVLEGDHSVFFPGNKGREGLIVYLVALATSTLGRSTLALRLPTALASAATVIAVFWLGRQLFSKDEEGRPAPWQGLFVAGVGAGLLAVSLNQTVLGRTALRGNLLPLLLSLCLALIWSGWRLSSWRRVALAGVCAGLLQYTYIAARFTPFLFAAIGLTFLYPLDRNGLQIDRIGLFGGKEGPGTGRAGGERPPFLARVPTNLAWAGLFFCTAALTAAPIFTYFLLNPDHFFERTGELLIFSQETALGGQVGALLDNVWKHLLSLGFHGDPSWRHNLSGRPLLNYGEAFFFFAGAAACLLRWGRPAYRLLLLWLGLMLLPAFLARDHAPNTLRMIGAAPAIYLLTAVGAWETLLLARRGLEKSPLAGGAGRVAAGLSLQWREAAPACAVTTAVVGILLAQGARTYSAYFEEWAAAPELYEAYETEWVELTRVLNSLPVERGTAYLIPYRIDHHNSFVYLYQGEAPARLIHAGASGLARRVDVMVSQMWKISTVKVVDWNNDMVWTGDSDQHILTLLDRYGRYRGREEYPVFHIHTYTDVDLGEPWTFYEYLEQKTIRYDGGIDLLGFAVGSGKEQMPARPLLDLGERRTLWTALKWQAKPDLEADLAISLRLYDADGAVAYQKDDVLGDTRLLRSSEWRESETVDTLHHLPLPTDLRAGEYEFRLVVYDVGTLTPVVEIDVWEPEATLARLRLDGGGG